MNFFLALFVLIAACLAAGAAIKGVASNAIPHIGASCIILSIIFIVLSLLILTGAKI